MAPWWLPVAMGFLVVLWLVFAMVALVFTPDSRQLEREISRNVEVRSHALATGQPVPRSLPSDDELWEYVDTLPDGGFEMRAYLGGRSEPRHALLWIAPDGTVSTDVPGWTGYKAATLGPERVSADSRRTLTTWGAIQLAITLVLGLFWITLRRPWQRLPLHHP